jgi:hypothetical protein
MYDGDILERNLSNADIVLANPPFENFSASERPSGSLVNKAAEVVRQTMLHLPRGGIFGFVLPQTFLNSKEGIDTRRRMLNECEVMEITLFADKVFEFGDPESVVILGHKPSGTALSSGNTIYQRVREKQVSVFKQIYEPSTGSHVKKSEFEKDKDANWVLQVLPEFWKQLANFRKLGDIVHVGQGLIHKGKDDPTLPPSAIRMSDKPFKGGTEGFAGWTEEQSTHTLPKPAWLNLDPRTIRRPVSGTKVGDAQVLLNYARTSRGEWRLKALKDDSGHPVTSRFLVVRPVEGNIRATVLWGVLNSPIANAYAFSVSSKRDVEAGDMRAMPVPNIFSSSTIFDLEQAVRTYFHAAVEFDRLKAAGGFAREGELFEAATPDAVTQSQAELHLKHLHWRVDAEVLKLYALPPEFERQLLDLFTGVQRRGVPFRQLEYFPPHFSDLQRLDDLLAITGEWEQTSSRKSALIDKKIAKTATEAELQELYRLKMLTEARAELFAPLPLSQLDAIKERLTAKGQWAGKP